MKGKEKHRFVNILRERYAKAGKVARGKLQGQICERLGVSRRHARRLMRPSRVGVLKVLVRPGRPSRYGSPEFVQTLHKLWKTTRFMCSRHLKSAIPDWLGYVEQEDEVYGAKVRPRLLSVSVATIDRILRPWKRRKGV